MYWYCAVEFYRIDFYIAILCNSQWFISYFHWIHWLECYYIVINSCDTCMGTHACLCHFFDECPPNKEIEQNDFDRLKLQAPRGEAMNFLELVIKVLCRTHFWLRNESIMTKSEIDYKKLKKNVVILRLNWTIKIESLYLEEYKIDEMINLSQFFCLVYARCESNHIFLFRP